MTADLQALKTTHSVLNGFFEKIDESLTTRITSLERGIARRLRRVEDEIRVLCREVDEMKASASHTGSGGAVVASRGKSTPLSVFTAKQKFATPHAHLVFTESTLSRVMSMKIVATVVAISAGDGEHSSPRLISKAVLTLFFSLQPNQTRGEFCVGIGRQHSRFRKSVVSNAIFNVQNNAFYLFRDPESSSPLPWHATPSDSAMHTNDEPFSDRGDDDSSEMGPAIAKFTQPKWLRKRFITSQDIDFVQEALEGMSKRGRGREDTRTKHIEVKEVPIRRDIAQHGVRKIFPLVKKHLHAGRDRAKSFFFGELGYLFTSWDAAGVSAEGQ